MSEEALYGQADGVLARSFADRAILARVGDDEFHVVTGSGRIVWELLSSPCTLLQLEQEVISIYEVDGSTVTRDVRQLVSELEVLGFLTRTEAAEEI